MKRKSLFLIFIFLFLAQKLEAKENKAKERGRVCYAPYLVMRLPAWACEKPQPDKKQKKPASSKQTKSSNSISSFFNFFKLKKAELPKIRFEIGFIGYRVFWKFRDKFDEEWRFSRLEPFIKLQWAILDKYIQPYVIFALSSTAINYRMSNIKLGDFNAKLDVNLKSNRNPFLGGGMDFFIFGWKKLNIYAYWQVQISSLNDVDLESISLTLDDHTFDLFNIAKKRLDISYTVEHYNFGLTVHYRWLRWLSSFASLGYVWFGTKTKIVMDQELINYLGFLTKDDPYWLIPKRLDIKASSVSALAGLKFRVHRRLCFNLAGAIIPAEQLIYFGQISLLIEGEK